MIKSVIWASMVDYPDNICTTLFIDGCNFNCEFCYNKNLSKEKVINFNKEIMPKLRQRKEFINHIILSGGECTVSPDFINIVDELYKEKFIIGIHTNGYNPNVLKKIIKKIDFVGMDIKNDFENYSKVARNIC